MGTWGVSDILYVYETIAASPASIYSAIASPAQLPDMSLRRGQASSSPYRAYSSYPAERKVSFLWRKKRLHVVELPYLCT